MFINITIESNAEIADIRIDSEQRIGQALTTLRESGKFSGESIPDYFHSRLNCKPVSAYMTFTEEYIFDGDILSSIE
ncbi:MAG: hypothetical protein LBD23_07910 [Oscillospiraceae bacterium]|jgi:hypothetical protein|nr:hypothetical protein [Oscillospiraceae bacterium]